MARETGLRLRVLELGASGGLNLRWDRYRYEADSSGWNDPASPVRITDPFAGESLPPFETPARVVERGGCNPRPLDPTDEEGRMTLLSYVWAGQHGRLRILRGALAAAARLRLVGGAGATSLDGNGPRRLQQRRALLGQRPPEGRPSVPSTTV